MIVYPAVMGTRHIDKNIHSNGYWGGQTIKSVHMSCVPLVVLCFCSGLWLDLCWGSQWAGLARPRRDHGQTCLKSLRISINTQPCYEFQTYTRKRNSSEKLRSNGLESKNCLAPSGQDGGSDTGAGTGWPGCYGNNPGSPSQMWSNI